MSKVRRAGRILSGLLMILGVILLISSEGKGIRLIVGILSLTFTIGGVKDILRYFTMTRHMVGGRTILYRGVIMLDFGVFAGSVTAAPEYYIALYLAGLYIFAGAVDVLRGMEAKQLRAGQWKISLGEGLTKIFLGVLCIVSIGSAEDLVILYCVGLLYSALTRIASAFRRTAVIYIQ